MTFDKQTAKRIAQMDITCEHYRDRYLDIAREMAAALDRIEELEKALIEERADSLDSSETKSATALAREQLKSEGKI